MLNNTENTSILIVDDNPTNLKILFEYLKMSGFNAFIAQDGESALRQLPLVKPDLILLDIMMPVMDGFETCQKIKAINEFQHIPVIFMTALSDITSKVKGFEVGGTDYITKPIQYEEVIARIKTHLTISTLQTQLQKRNEELDQMNKNKDKFFAIIAHDLKNPFSTIKLFTEYLKGQAAAMNPEELQSEINELYNVVGSYSEYLNDLLRWSMSQIGGMKINEVEVDINILLKEVVNYLNNMAVQKKIEINLDLFPDKIVAMIDIDMFKIIISNLLSNSIKYTNTGGKISVQTILHSSTYEIIVTDNGMGMSAEALQNIQNNITFHSSYGTNKEKGTGMGLILIKELVGILKGEISYESKIHEGTKVYLTLPLTL